jgi:hypothetical protein
MILLDALAAAIVTFVILGISWFISEIIRYFYGE